MKGKLLLAATTLLLLTSPALANEKGDYMSRMKEMDTNKDQMISKDEWSQKHEEKFQKADKNSDGRLDEQEQQALREMKKEKRMQTSRAETETGTTTGSEQ